MNRVSYIIGNAGDINFVIDNQSHTIAVDHVNYQEILDRLVEEKYDGIVELLDIASSITLASEGAVTVLDGCVCYNGNEVINPLTDRILRFVKEGLPFKPMTRFLENLMENPSRTSIQELYLFLEEATLPITEDGCFLAYRKVDNEYMSYHPNPDGTKNSNKIGEVIEQKRNEVDDIRDNLCSNGLHFCSMSYLPKYHGGSGRVMIVKINPSEVVSIPSDYNNAKGRCCKYEVVGEHTEPEKESTDYTTSAVVDAGGGELECSDCGCELDECVCDLCPDCGYHTDDCECEETCPDCFQLLDDCECDALAQKEESKDSTLGQKPNGQNFHNLRDAMGRFFKKS